MHDPRYEVTTVDGPSDHPAALAWRQLGLTQLKPVRIDVLKDSHKTLACRLYACGPERANVIAKRRVTAASTVEKTIYCEILARLPGPCLRLLGSLDESQHGMTWLFLDDGGEEMPDFNDPAQMALASSWIGRLHAEVAQMSWGGILPERAAGQALYDLRTGRDGIVAGLGNPQVDAIASQILAALARRLDTIEAGWREIEAQVSGLPTTLVHGDFVPKNLRLRRDQRGQSILPFDWETSGWGAPLADLELIDLEAYASAARGYWGELVDDLAYLAEIGRMFRLLAAISWETPTLETPWIRRPIGRLALYDERLALVVSRLRRQATRRRPSAAAGVARGGVSA